MRRVFSLLTIFAILPAGSLVAQNSSTSVSFFATLSTESELFHHPNDPDELLRSEYYPLNTIFGGGIDIRKAIAPLRLSVGASVEYLSKSETFSVATSGISTTTHLSTNLTVPVSDGYGVTVIELSVYVPLPIGNENFQVYIGGGGGGYFGGRDYSYAGIAATTTDRSPGYGIHILSGAEYNLSSVFSLRTDVKFRDVHFETTDTFPVQQTTVQGSALLLPQGPQQSRVNVDGLAMAVQFAYRF